MIRIGASISGFERQLLNQLAEANAAAATNSLRLASGKKVLRPSDDPAAFVQISNFETRLSSVKQSITQINAASTVASQTQLTIDQIRTQLNTIRTALVADENGSLSSSDRALKQSEIDVAINALDDLADLEVNGRRLLDGSADFRTSGLNPSQIRQLEVFSVGAGSPIVPRQQAELLYTGTGRKITADANITITGDSGSATISVNNGDALTDVADIINNLTNSTGVTATADGDKLTLRSTEFGTTAGISVNVNSGTFAVTGGNGDGTATGVNQVIASGPAISGSVLTAATQASLVYTGTSGQVGVGDTATFTLTGKRGATTISTTGSEALTAVRDRINADSHKTGITASVAGDDLTFTSVDYGTQATINVNVTSGTFAVTGGNNDGTAQGVNAVAQINGRTISGNTAAQTAKLVHTELTGQFTANTDITLAGSLGSFAFSFTSATTLTAAASTINGQQGTTGVKASVSADGFDLILESTTVGPSGSVSVEVTDGVFAVTPDSTSTVTTQIAAEPGQIFYNGNSSGEVIANATFNITGALGTASGLSVTQGQSLASVATLISNEKGTTGVEAEVVNGQLVIRSTTTGPAAFADLDVTAGTFTITGGDTGGRDYGLDAKTVVTGADAVTNLGTVDGNRVSFNENGLQLTIEFAAGFSGQFDTEYIYDDTALKFAITPDPSSLVTLGIQGLQASQLGGTSGTLDQLATGGSLAGLAGNVAQAIRVVDEALGQLARVEGRVDGFANGTIASSSTLMTAFETDIQNSLNSLNGIDSAEENLLLAKNQALATNALSAISVLQQQQSDIVSIIKLIAGIP